MTFRKPDLGKDSRQAARWVRERIPEVHLPEVRLPRMRDVHLPNVQLPDMHLPKVRAADLAAPGRDAVAWVVEHLPSAPRRRRGPEPASLVLPAVLAAAGAGAAFWWWTQWSRGRAEQQAAEEGAAHPETIMAHSPPPPPEGDAPNPSLQGLKVPAEEVMAHNDVPAAARPKRKLKGVDPVVAPTAKAALKRSLAVQASAEPPAPKRARKSPPKGAAPSP